MKPQLTRVPPVLMGTGLGLFKPKMIAWLLVVAAGLLALDYGVSRYQRYLLEQRRQVKARLQRAALFNLRADVADIAYGPHGTYRLTLYLDNPFPEEPLYVMVPDTQAYVQVGTIWKEVPSRSVTDQEGSVVKLTERRTFDYVFEPGPQEFEELIPGYMHMRFANAMLISRRSEPKDDLVERIDNYYVYLKPRGTDDKQILRKNSFPGQPPLWIPMPPH